MTSVSRRWPFHVQVLLALLVIAVLAMLFTGELVRRKSTDYLNADLERQSQIMLSMLAGASMDAVISADLPVLATVVSEAGRRDADITFVAIYTRDRQEMAHWKRANLPAETNISRYEQAITLEGETFGFIHIDWDISARQQEIDAHVWQIRLMVMLALLATIVVVLVMLGGLALRPLARVRTALLDLSDRKARAALDHVRTSREIDQIISAVHALALAQDHLTAARDRAEAASRAKSEFLAVMGHELRTPLHCMMGMSDLLAMTELDEQQKECLETIQSSSHGLFDILSAVLQYASIDLDAKPETNIYDLGAIVDQQLARVRKDADHKGLALERATAQPIPVLEGNEKALTQILQILLDNAVKFTPAGKVLVSVFFHHLDQDDCELEIEVHDTGIGIPDGKLEAIFEPFTQADSSATRGYEGIGLGLAIARQLARMLGGRLWATSTEGAGSVFHLRLIQAVAPPLLKDELDELRDGAAVPPAPTLAV
jgi:two-component system, sensor histidine kinase and response regulator